MFAQYTMDEKYNNCTFFPIVFRPFAKEVSPKRTLYKGPFFSFIVSFAFFSFSGKLRTPWAAVIALAKKKEN